MSPRHHAVVGWGTTFETSREFNNAILDDDDFIFGEGPDEDDDDYVDLSHLISYVWSDDDTPLKHCHSGHQEGQDRAFVFAASTQHLVGQTNDIPWNMEIDTSGGPTKREREAMETFMNVFEPDGDPSWRLNGSQE